MTCYHYNVTEFVHKSKRNFGFDWPGLQRLNEPEGFFHVTVVMLLNQFEARWKKQKLLKKMPITAE